MAMFHLKIISPRRVVLDENIDAVSVPSADGELTVLPHHANLFALLVEGIVKIRVNHDEQFIAIGGGYIETNGEEITVLVSKAYKQNEIDKAVTQKAVEDAKKILTTSKDENQRENASALLRRSLIELKLLKKKAPKSFSENV